MQFLYLYTVGEPHSIIVIVFVIFTAGIGWVLYKYLTKTKGMYVHTHNLLLCITDVICMLYSYSLISNPLNML